MFSLLFNHALRYCKLRLGLKIVHRLCFFDHGDAEIGKSLQKTTGIKFTPKRTVGDACPYKKTRM